MIEASVQGLLDEKKPPGPLLPKLTVPVGAPLVVLPVTVAVQVVLPKLLTGFGEQPTTVDVPPTLTVVEPELLFQLAGVPDVKLPVTVCGPAVLGVV